MQKAFARLTALLLAVILLATVMTGCGEKIEGNNYIELNGKKVAIPYALKIGDVEASMEAYRYYFLMFKTNYFDNGDESYWTKHPEDEEKLKEAAASYCKTDIGYKLLAEHYGLSIGEDEMALIDQQIEGYRSSYKTEEEFQAVLAEQYLTESLYRELLVPVYLQKKIADHLFGEGGQMALVDKDGYIAENYVHVQHILIADKDKAQDVLDRVKGGEDFVALMKEFNEDPGETEEGYTFTTGQMVESFEKAAFALEENAVSDLVESTYGYHIIKRLPLDKDYIEKNKENMLSDYYDTEVASLLQSFLTDKEVEYSTYYKQFGVDTILPVETKSK